MKYLPAVFLSFGLLLAGCGGSPADGKGGSEASGSDNALRQEFSKRFAEQCMAQVPKDSEILQSRAKMLCDCATVRVAQQVSVADFTSLLSGSTQELQTKFGGIIRECAQEQLMPASAPVSASPAPASGASAAK